LLRRIAERSSLTINITIVTIRTRLARLLELRAPRPDLRLDAVRKLREAGLRAGVFAMPVLPGITDSEKELDALAHAASDAGAQWFVGGTRAPDAVGREAIPAVCGREIPAAGAALPRLVRARGLRTEAYRKEIEERVANVRAEIRSGGASQRARP